MQKIEKLLTEKIIFLGTLSFISERLWYKGIMSWWKGIPDIFMDEIIVNPDRLQTSSLILTHPSQVTAEGGWTMCSHSSLVQVFYCEESLWIIRLILLCGSFIHLHQSRESLKVRVHHLRTNIWLKSNPHGEKTASFFHINTVFSCFFIDSLPL